MKADLGILSLWYFLQADQSPGLEDPQVPYGPGWEEQEVRELAEFVRQALEELHRRGSGHPSVPVSVYGKLAIVRIRITRDYRIYFGDQELKIRPMAKSVLLLFLRHPEGIPLKCIGNYREELARYYRRVSRSLDPESVERSIQRLLDIFSNDLNVSIARVNAAVRTLVGNPVLYQIGGASGSAKSILLDRSYVQWE